MQPIAQKVLRELKKNDFTNVVALDRAHQAAIGATAPDLEGLTEGQRRWLLDFAFLSRIASGLLATRTLAKLADRIQGMEERYTPGGPPMSPVLDSFFMAWSLTDTPVGSAGETLATVVLQVLKAQRAPRDRIEVARTFAESYCGFYVLEKRTGRVVHVRELVLGGTFEVHLSDDCTGRAGDVWWTRLLPNGDGTHTSHGAPYVFTRPDAARELKAYFTRKVKPLDAKSYVKFLRRGDSKEHWFEFVMDAYAGADDVTVHLTGVPDRAETLPHSSANEDAAPSPLVTARQALSRWAEKRGWYAIALDAFETARAELRLEEAEPAQWPQDAQHLLFAYAMFGALDDDGRTAVEVALETGALQLDTAERASLSCVRDGWFSIFEITLVRVGEGLELRDLLRRRRLDVLERSATKMVSVGDLLAGWVTKEPDGTTRLEGALVHVPHLIIGRFVDMMRDLNDVFRRRWPRLPAAKRVAMIAPFAAGMSEWLRANPPIPTLVDAKTNEPLEMCRAHYEVLDAAPIRAALDAAPDFEAADVGWHWTDPGPPGLVELTSDALIASTTVRSRLDRLERRVAALGGSAVRHRERTFEDYATTIRRERGRAAPPEPLPPEAIEALREMLLARMMVWVDLPIPVLDGRTPRQAVRSQRGRAQVTALLMEQERAFETMPGAEGLDLASVWQALGLQRPML